MLGLQALEAHQRLPDHSWGHRQHTLMLDLEITLRETACVLSLLMTDMTVKCDELVRLPVVHGLGYVKTKGNISKTTMIMVQLSTFILLQLIK